MNVNADIRKVVQRITLDSPIQHLYQEKHVSYILQCFAVVICKSIGKCQVHVKYTSNEISIVYKML